jgi:hypothetical protein
MSGSFDPVGTGKTILDTLKDTPLWLLTGVTLCFFVVPFVPGADQSIPPVAFGWMRIAGTIFFVLSLCRLGSIIIPITKTRIEQRASAATLYLTFHDQQSFWHISKQPDGSYVTQFALRFTARNLTDTPIHLLKARIIKPRLFGETLNSMVHTQQVESNFSGAGYHIPPHGLAPISASLLFRARPRQRSGRMNVLLGVSDDRGRETKVSISVRNVG